MNRVLAWFSCGAASAVAAKLVVEAYGPRAEVVYCDTLATEHADNARFFADVQRWIGRDIRVIRSAKYATIDEVFERRKYMAGRRGAICTTEMKKIPREAFQHPNDTHVFGYTAEEQRRADRFEGENPALAVEWILIDRGIAKDDCKRIVVAAGIALPKLYDLGFDHNNCLGCVKSQSPGYWNRVRRQFPEVFARRAAQSRAIGARLVIIGRDGKKNIRCFLDELPPEADAPDDIVDCGPVCQASLDLGPT